MPIFWSWDRKCCESISISPRGILIIRKQSIFDFWNLALGKELLTDSSSPSIRGAHEDSFRVWRPSGSESPCPQSRYWGGEMSWMLTLGPQSRVFLFAS